MKQQTAIEWLESLYYPNYIPKEIIEQAKEMEKQQIIEAHGNKTKKSAGVTNYLYTLTGEQYYNKTYGRQTED